MLPALRYFSKLGNEQGIPAEIDCRTTGLEHVRDLGNGMFPRTGGYRDWPKHGRFPGVHLNYIREPIAACRLPDSSLDCDGYLLLWIGPEGLHIVVIVMTVADDYPGQLRQILQSYAVRFPVIVAKSL